MRSDFIGDRVEVNLVIGLTEQPMPPQLFYARTLRDVGNQLLEIAYAVRIAFDESVNELSRGGFFFSLQVLNVLRIVRSSRVFLDDTGDQVILFLGGRRVINSIRESLYALTSAHVFYKVSCSGGIPDVPTCKNNLRHAMIFDTGRLLQR